MYLNDAFDREIDAGERPERPIPSGLVSANSVFAAGFGLILFGLGLVLWAAAERMPGGGHYWPGFFSRVRSSSMIGTIRAIRSVHFSWASAEPWRICDRGLRCRKRASARSVRRRSCIVVLSCRPHLHCKAEISRSASVWMAAPVSVGARPVVAPISRPWFLAAHCWLGCGSSCNYRQSFFPEAASQRRCFKSGDGVDRRYLARRRPLFGERGSKCCSGGFPLFLGYAWHADLDKGDVSGAAGRCAGRESFRRTKLG